MSIIPDCRPKYEKDCGIHKIYAPKTPIDEKQINNYWYGLLVGDDKQFVNGFDWNTTATVCNLFDNLDVYADELAECGVDIDEIDCDVVNGAYGKDLYNINFNPDMQDQREFKWLEEYSQEELNKMNKHTKLMLTIKSILLDYIEKERDMLVTSMIDDMDDDIHKSAVEKAENE